MFDLIALTPRVVAANRYHFTPGETIGASWSASLHLVIVTGGSGRISLGGNSYDLLPGMIAAMLWGRRWAFAAARREPLAIISVHLHFLPWDAPDPGRPKHGLHPAVPPPAGPAPVLAALPRPRQAGRCRELAEDLLAAWHVRNDVVREARLRGLALALVTELHPAPAAAGKAHPQAARITGLVDWLDHHPGVFPPRGELEARAGLGRTAFGAAFREVTGESPAAWLMARRLAAAQRLLTTTELPIGEIAARTGFPDPFHFSRRFRDRYRRSPRASRR